MPDDILYRANPMEKLKINLRGNSAMPAKSKIDKELLEAIMCTYPNVEDIAAIFKLKSTDTVHKFIKKEFNTTFSKLRDKHMSNTRYLLKRKCIDKALRGDNTMLIWTTKNLCGWSDRIEEKIEVTANKPFQLAYDPMTFETIKSVNPVEISDESVIEVI